jgi:hypothetical protein
MKLKQGQYVRHSKYGWGTVLERDAQQTTVYFNSVGVRKFAPSQSTFEVVESKSAKKKSGG